ncbi:MAG: acyl carrier protein [Bacteroidota bacterium]|jgi:acyl carrier protein
MDIQLFLQQIADQFDDTDPSLITLETKFKQLDDYSSLTALNIISMIDDEYDVILKGEDLRNSTTVEDLYNAVKVKL